MTPPRRARPVVGWREWVRLPALTDEPIKAKLDTGARTSALHAFGLDIRESGGVVTASFEVHPRQRSGLGARRVVHEVTEFRRVRSSNGRSELRPVITTPLILDGATWSIEITLTLRDQMGFRLLLGRAALRRRLLVDPGHSFLTDPDPSPRSPKATA